MLATEKAEALSSADVASENGFRLSDELRGLLAYQQPLRREVSQKHNLMGNNWKGGLDLS